MKNALHKDRFGANIRALRRTAALLLTAALASGCPAGKEPPDASIMGKVVIKGSNTFGEELALRLIAEYHIARPNVTVALESKGSGSGFTALLAGECDIAAASRAANTAELQQARANGIELIDEVIGYYGVAVIINTNNPLAKLTRAQVRDVFTGAILNWKGVGGIDGPIRLCIRDPISGTHLGFRELAMENKAYAPAAQTFTNYMELAAAVAQDSKAVGYASMSLAERAGVKELPIGGILPSISSVNEDLYPYARVLRLCTIKGRENRAAKDFIHFVQSSRGQRVLAETGFVRRFERRFGSSFDD